MNAEQLSKIKIRSGIGGPLQGPSDHEQTINQCMFEFKVLAMLRHIVEQATKHATVAARCRSSSEVEDEDMVLALKYVAVTWIDTPDIESKIQQYYEHEVTHGEKSLSHWFSNVNEKGSNDGDEEGAATEEDEESDENEDGEADEEEDEEEESESEWESMTSDEIAALGDLENIGEATAEYAKVETSELSLPVTQEDKEMYEKMKNVAEGWDTWFPSDGISQILKNAVQASINKCLKTK